MLKRFIWSWIGNAAGLFVASLLLSGVDYQRRLIVLVIASFIFGLINALIRPIVVIISLPAIVLTLGIFTLVVNALMLWLTSKLYPSFQLKSIWAAVGAVIIVWLVNYCIDIFILKEEDTL